ncbi:hypothetical protein QJQ45_029063 [Haematococcus lacustris]|nr:hypothetical protein QJQ45_029063 [Haematococcus lacustris]
MATSVMAYNHDLESRGLEEDLSRELLGWDDTSRAGEPANLDSDRCAGRDAECGRLAQHDMGSITAQPGPASAASEPASQAHSPPPSAALAAPQPGPNTKSVRTKPPSQRRLQRLPHNSFPTSCPGHLPHPATTGTPGMGCSGSSKPVDLDSVEEAPPSLALWQLPGEVLVRVCAFLSAQDLCSLSPASHLLQRLAGEELLWRRLYCARWGRPTQQRGEASWKAQYRMRDVEEWRAAVDAMQDAPDTGALYLHAQRARRQTCLGRSHVDDPMEVPLSLTQERLAAWRRRFAAHSTAPSTECVPPAKKQCCASPQGLPLATAAVDAPGSAASMPGEQGQAALQVEDPKEAAGGSSGQPEVAGAAAAQQVSRRPGEAVVDPTHSMLVCPISCRTVDRMMSEWELEELNRGREGPLGHDEQDVAADFSGFVGRAFERGYNSLTQTALMLHQEKAKHVFAHCDIHFDVADEGVD